MSERLLLIHQGIPAALPDGKNILEDLGIELRKEDLAVQEEGTWAASIVHNQNGSCLVRISAKMVSEL